MCPFLFSLWPSWFLPPTCFFRSLLLCSSIPYFQLLRPKTSESSFLHTSHSICEESLSVYLLHPYLLGQSPILLLLDYFNSLLIGLCYSLLSILSLAVKMVLCVRRPHFSTLKPLMAPNSLRVKALPELYPSPLPLPCLYLLHSAILVSWLFLVHSGIFLPQGFCTCCAFCFESCLLEYLAP